MTAPEFLAALHQGKLGAAIADAWLRAGDAEWTAEAALLLAVFALVLSIVSLFARVRR